VGKLTKFLNLLQSNISPNGPKEIKEKERFLKARWQKTFKTSSQEILSNP
jgi:hypothetical protein